VTVCLCTRDSPGYARLCLDSLRSQTVGPQGFEVVVVDSASAAEAAAELRRLVAAMPNARLLRLERPGLSLARNAGARAATGDYVAFIDDDAAAAPDWVERIKRAVRRATPARRARRPRAAGVGGAAAGLVAGVAARGPDHQRVGGRRRVPHRAGPGRARALRGEHGGGARRAPGGRRLRREPRPAAGPLLSDEDVQLAWKLQQGGRSARHDARIVVHHRIQAGRLTPDWLLARLYWQGMSTVATRRLLGRPDQVWREFPRRLAVRLLCAPAAAMVPRAARGCWRCAGGTPTRAASPAWRSAGVVSAAAGPGAASDRSGPRGPGPAKKGAHVRRTREVQPSGVVRGDVPTAFSTSRWSVGA
jgi:hypothetical protein